MFYALFALCALRPFLGGLLSRARGLAQRFGAKELSRA
jgi:hypothetical protein